MASAQILQLYYTKDHKSQQGNQSKYHHQRSKPLLQGRRSITIHRKQFQTLPQNNNTFPKLTEHFYRFQSSPTEEDSKRKSKNPSESITTDPWHQLQHHQSLFTNNNIEKCVPRTETTSSTTTPQQAASITSTDSDSDSESKSNQSVENIEEKDTSNNNATTTTSSSNHTPTAWWRDIPNFRKDETPSPEDDATSAAIAADAFDDCEVPLPVADPGRHHHHGCPTPPASANSPPSGRATTKATSNPQQYNHMANNANENNHFQYKMCSLHSSSQSPPSSALPTTSSSAPSSEFCNDDIGKSNNNEFAAQQTSSIPQRIDTFITGSQSDATSKAKGATSTNVLLRPVPGETTTDCVNFFASTSHEGENNYATPRTSSSTSLSSPTPSSPSSSSLSTTTTTTRKTKNCAICCQNNAPSNSSVTVALGVDQTCFLQKRIDFSRNDSHQAETNAGCQLCKLKPITCQKSKKSSGSYNGQCCDAKAVEPCPTMSTLVGATLDRHNKRNWNNAKRLQSSDTSTFTDCSAASSSFLLQSGSTTRTTKLSQLSSKKPQQQQQQQEQKCCCNNERRFTTTPLQQHQSQPIEKQKQHQQQQQHQLRQQRTTKCNNFDWTLCNNSNNNTTNNNNSTINNNNNINHHINQKANTTSRAGPATSSVASAAPSAVVASRSRLNRKLSESSINAFIDVQRFTRAILPFIIIFNILPLLYAECDQTFVSRVGGPQNGTFSAPLVHNPRNHSRQCLYIFLAGPGQRVEVVFTTFNLRGSPPDGSAVGELPTCVHEYMDIYSEVQSSDPADLINSPFGGRFCGTIPPRRRISMHRAIAISFFTNKNVSEPDLFEGHYRFLNASEYEIGIPIAGSPCSYTITPSMSINKTGALISPTYPGAYPKDMSCTYQFLGETNQRVRLEFRDFDLFFGGPHCPFDYVKVYDGPDNSSALIGTYCGQQRNLVLYSSESSLFVHFYTLPRTANTQNRGFKGIYEFSESFVKLDFIRENDGIHIRGSECDQKILSKKESTGSVLSPNYPYPYIPKTVCRYFIYGMQDAQHLERVRLEFSAFNIPKVEHRDKSETNCSDGYLKIYLKGQETADAYDKFDYELCGNETQRVVSDGPRLAMVFSSGELQGRGFKGKYTFETEYKIPGTAAPDGTCSFTYVSSSKKRGELNSPRYPSNYPSETNCSYLFLPEPNEQVTIVFDHFKVKADNVNATAGAYGASACFEDWLEMYVIYKYNSDRFLGRYCGLTAPGPVESPRGAVGLRITLHTDQENVASGFKARYYFETAKSEVGDCGGNFSNEDSGIITSPHYPSNYKSPPKGMASMACNWYMTARAGYKLSINFEHFSVEGDPTTRGCPAAVLRMWTNVDSDAAPVELCGEKPPNEHWHYISTGLSARISFTTTDKTIGAQGFRIVWTEIQDSGPGPPAIGLLCESTFHFQCNVGYCISDKLRCDGVKNCGPGDDSDEMHCITEAPKEDHGVLIIISMAAVSFLICLLCTLCHRQKKRRHRQLGLHRNTGHYDSTTSATGLSSSRRHLQGGGSLSGSLHGINSGTLIIPPAPLPPTSVPPPPHICIAGTGAGGGLAMGGIGSGMIIGSGLDDDDDNDDDEDNPDIFINDIRFDENNLDQLETV